MCGITGKITFNQNKVKYPELKNMTDSILHGAPNGEGHWISSDKTIGLGHRRLSIIDSSENATKPMHSSDDPFVLSFNGVISPLPEYTVSTTTYFFSLLLCSNFNKFFTSLCLNGMHVALLNLLPSLMDVYIFSSYQTTTVIGVTDVIKPMFQ